MADGADAATGGLSPSPVAEQAGGKRSAWIAHIKSVAKAKGIKYGDAMKIASKTFKGGELVGKGVPMGGKRRGTKKAGKRRGGALYGFGGGDGNSSADGGLVDGAGAYGNEADSTWKGPGSSELTGASSGPGPAAAAAAGGRRRRRSRSRRRMNSKKAMVRGTRRR